MAMQLRRWLPDHALILVADSSYAVLDFLHHCQTLYQPVTVITHLRLDVALYEPAPSYSGKGRPRRKGTRLPTLKALLQDPNTAWTRLKARWYDHQEREIEVVTGTAIWLHYGLSAVSLRYVLIQDVRGGFAPQALLCTDDTLSPEQILSFFMRRWQMEPTFQHVRTHLGVETQRQWSDKAIARTTPALMGLFSLITVLADTLIANHGVPVRTSAWYARSRPTFSDALALVRTHIWRSRAFQTSCDEHDTIKVPRFLFERFTDLLAYPA